MIRAMISNVYLLPMFRLLVIQRLEMCKGN